MFEAFLTRSLRHSRRPHPSITGFCILASPLCYRRAMDRTTIRSAAEKDVTRRATAPSSIVCPFSPSSLSPGIVEQRGFHFERNQPVRRRRSERKTKRLSSENPALMDASNSSSLKGLSTSDRPQIPLRTMVIVYAI